MIKEELAKYLIHIRDLSQQMAVKEESIDNVLAYADEILRELNATIQSTADYFNAPAESKTPMPSWISLASEEEANKSIQRLKNLMAEGAPVLSEIIAFREQYNAFNKDFAACMQNITATFKEAGIAIDHATATTVSAPLQALDQQLNSLLTSASGYESRMKQIKSELNVIKQVN